MYLRAATHDDLPAILELYNEILLNSTAIFQTEPRTLTERAEWLESRRAKGYPVLVAVDNDGQLFGFSSFGEWRSAAGYRHTVEHTVHVSSSARKQGVGTALLQALFPIARGLGMHTMIGAVEASNTGSLRFHERLGFTQVAHFREVGRKFDLWLDLIFVQRIL